MSEFNLDDKHFYVIGAHGCAPELKTEENSEDFSSNRFFIVPRNFMIVYLTSNGVQSEGSKNIPFLKNLYNYNNNLFKYIFNPANYEINLDKINPSSYRHCDFFKSLPFYSNFNYLCNFELYPPGVPCPFIKLNFSDICSLSSNSISNCYFEGITSLDNIQTISDYGDRLNIIDESNVLHPKAYLRDTGGWTYPPEVINVLRTNFGIEGGVLFVSACRAEYFTNKMTGQIQIVDLHPIQRNCGDNTYDLAFVDNLITNYPESRSSLENVKKRLSIRNKKKTDVDRIILRNYTQSNEFYNKNFLNEFYQYLSILSGNINICINFKKITINSNLLYLSDYKKSLLAITDTKFNDFRKALIDRPQPITECNNIALYNELGFIYRFVFFFIKKNNRIPDENNFIEFWNWFNTNSSDINFDELNTEQINEKKKLMTQRINNYIIPIYDFALIGGINNPNPNPNSDYYKNKYLKYKNKYIYLKKNL